MGASYFQFKQFIIHQQHCSMKVTTDACLFGAWVANKIENDKSTKNILDIGSGSGLLSLMLAQKTPATIDGIELQKSDYLQSLENIASSPWKERVNIIHADAINYSFTQKYEAIISNPPFYENDLKGGKKSKNIAHHDEGLTIKDLIPIITKQLSENGKFYLLLPAKREDEILKAISNSSLSLNQVTYVHQTEKHPAFRIMIKAGWDAKPKQTEKIIIKENDNYSARFMQLLRDYYLYIG